MTTREALDKLDGIFKRSLLTPADHFVAQRAMKWLYKAVHDTEIIKDDATLNASAVIENLESTIIAIKNLKELLNQPISKDTAALDQAQKEKGFTTHLTSPEYGRVLCGVSIYNFNVLNEKTTPKESEVNCRYCLLEIKNRE